MVCDTGALMPDQPDRGPHREPRVDPSAGAVEPRHAGFRLWVDVGRFDWELIAVVSVTKFASGTRAVTRLVAPSSMTAYKTVSGRSRRKHKLAV